MLEEKMEKIKTKKIYINHIPCFVVVGFGIVILN
jgi:hypothetical protein